MIRLFSNCYFTVSVTMDGTTGLTASVTIDGTIGLAVSVTIDGIT